MGWQLQKERVLINWTEFEQGGCPNISTGIRCGCMDGESNISGRHVWRGKCNRCGLRYIVADDDNKYVKIADNGRIYFLVGADDL